MVSGYLIAIAILSFLISFAIGANDAANALATSYGSKALRLRYLVILGAIFEFIGAFWCSGHVAGKLVSNIIEETDTLSEMELKWMMLGTSISSIIFIMASSFFGIPISGTHTIVGAIIGAGIAVVGVASINWLKLAMIVISWFVAPILAIILCALFFIAVCALTLDSTRFSFQARLLWLTLICGLAVTLICGTLLALLTDKDEPWTVIMWVCLGVSPIVGIVITRITLVILIRYSEKHAEAAQPGQEDALKNARQEAVIAQLYRGLMLVAAMMVCLGHGSNDVANSISPLLIVMETEGGSIQLAYAIGSAGIALGLLILGYRVMETVGTKVVKLDFAKGFTA
jgi:PiT family inorganic phosphate transporter